MQGRVKYKIVSCSSEDKDHPVSNLLVRGSSGWQSGRFCSYPQEITLQFYSPVHVKQLQFMSNCRKIARRIDILYYSEKDSVESRFSKYGFVQLSTNEQTNFEGREFKTIMVDMHCSYVRFLMHQPHPNKQNFFSQVGLHEINVIGEGFDVLAEPAAAGRQQPQPADDLDDKSIEDEFIHSKLIVLHQYKEKAAMEENYDEAKRLKEIINNVKSLGYQIRGLEDKKREAVEHQDYDRAQKLKFEIERIRSSAESVISNVNNPQFRVKTIVREQEEGEEGITSLEKSHVSRHTLPKEADNQFVEEFRDYRKEPTMRINHDDKVIPTFLGKQKTEIKEDDPPPSTNDNLPVQPEPLSTQQEKEGAVLLSLFDEITVRQYFSKHWQFRLEALKTFLNELHSPQATKGKDPAALFRMYMNIVSVMLGEKVVQIAAHSLQLLQQILLQNQKTHNEARIHEFQGDADNILQEVLRRMNDNNGKVRALAEQIFRKMTQSGLYGVVVCCSALMRVSTKLSPKQYKSKLDTLIYLIELHGIGAHAVPLTTIDFAVGYVGYQSLEVRNSAIDLLVQSALKGAEERVQLAIEKLEPNVKEMIQKKMKNAQQARDAASKGTDAKKSGKSPVAPAKKENKK